VRIDSVYAEMVFLGQGVEPIRITISGNP